MTLITLVVGIIASGILLYGASINENENIKNPIKSKKNWFFLAGASLMLVYAILSFYSSSLTLFFVLLQSLAVLSGILMMLNTPDKIDLPIISLIGTAFIYWALNNYTGINTIFFIIGLTGTGLGYAFEMGTIRRYLCLSFGTLLIAIFSFIEQAWIFFFLKSFFSAFSFIYLYKIIKRQKTTHPIILKILNKLKKTEGEKPGHISDVA